MRGGMLYAMFRCRAECVMACAVCYCISTQWHYSSEDNKRDTEFPGFRLERNQLDCLPKRIRSWGSDAISRPLLAVPRLCGETTLVTTSRYVPKHPRWMVMRKVFYIDVWHYA
ncbi:hypothetical protein IG631_09626 [Alternaria alternata]|nr:hypothetical protein IG631_09626 [Alternaria alternata]